MVLGLNPVLVSVLFHSFNSKTNFSVKPKPAYWGWCIL